MKTDFFNTLTFENTLPFSLVHKPSNDSVLLTDYIAQSRLNTLLGAQVSRANGLYQENIIDPRGYDIAALVEICRQACFAIAHNQFDLSLAENRYQFLFRELEADIVSEALNTQHRNGHPIKVVVESTIEKEVRTEGRTSGLSWRYVLSTPEHSKIATIRIKQSFVDRAQWKRIRQTMCEEHGVVFQSPIVIPPDSELQPADVARWNPQNLTLLRVHRSDNRYEALGRFDPRHPVLFDRPTADHIFAMTQLEACRQLAIYAVAKSLDSDPFQLKVSSCSVIFQSMGELNIPTELHAEVLTANRCDRGATVEISVRQPGRVVSTFQVGVSKLLTD